MVKGCSVWRCTNRSNGKARERGVKFFKFPMDRHKRRSWIKALNRKDWEPTANSFVCSYHFVSGWHAYDRSELDYTPTVFHYKQKATNPARTNRAFRRNLSKTFEEAAHIQKEQEEGMLRQSMAQHDYVISTDTDQTECTDKSYSTTGIQSECDPVLEENISLKEENALLKERERKLTFSVDEIRNNDKATRFYTGLPTFGMFLWLFNFVKLKAERMTFWDGQNTPGDRKRPMKVSIPLVDQLLAVLMRLKLGLFVQDIADRFGLSCSTFSNLFVSWICLLYEELKIINMYPSRDLINQNMPEGFKSFPNLRIIIDCTEIFVQRSSSLVNLNLLYSNYKHHATLKFLIGITPSGVISYVSDDWGGKVSDRRIVIESGFLDLLEPGDNVMADKGFTISDLLRERKCLLNIPPFKRGNSQFTVEEVFATQSIAKVRIHVERSIGRVKKFHLFDGVLPLTLAPIASKCFKVACWLTNLDVPIV